MSELDKDIIDNYNSIDYSIYPESHEFNSALEKSLLVLYVVKKGLGLEAIRSFQIRSILLKVYSDPLSERAISNALARAGKKILITGKKVKSFEIMREGELVVEARMGNGVARRKRKNATKSYDALVNLQGKKVKINEQDRKVFIVFGHDAVASLTVEKFVKQLKLEPVILAEKENKGKTIIQKLETYSNVGYAIIIYTPDDVAAAKRGGDKVSPRARQNVIFEHGYFVGKLGIERTAFLYMGKIEIPSDIAGLVYIPFDHGDKWKKYLFKELKVVWNDIDFNDTI